MVILFIASWLGLSFVAGFLGMERTCGFGGAFLASLVFSPLIGFIVVLASTKKSTLTFQKKMLAKESDLAQPLTADKAYLEEYYKEIGRLDAKLDMGSISAIEYEERKEKLNALLKKRQSQSKSTPVKEKESLSRPGDTFLGIIIIIAVMIIVAHSCGN